MKIRVRTFLANGSVALVLLFVALPRVAWAESSVAVFQGANTYINLGTPDALQLTNHAPFSVEAWVCVGSHQEIAPFFSKSGGRKDPVSFLFGLTDNGTKMSARSGTVTWREMSLPEPVIPGDWHHLAFSFDGTDMAYFFDGTFLGKLTYSFVNNASHSIKIGGYMLNIDWWGKLAEVRFWDHPRDLSQVQGDMNRRLKGNEEGLLGYCRLMKEKAISLPTERIA